MKIKIVGTGRFAYEMQGFVQTGFTNFASSELVSIEDFDGADDKNCEFMNYVIAIGSTAERKLIISKLSTTSKCNLLVGNQLIAETAKIGSGNIIMNNITIANEAIVGNHCVLHGNVVIGHDVVIGNNVSIGANVFIGGGSVIEDDVTIHPGAMIRNYITIGYGATIGIGSVVVKSVKNEKVMFGNPAVVIK